MELKEYLEIIKKQWKTFVFIIFLVIAGSLLYFLFRPISYSTSLTINITRTGRQITGNYKYDDFYRLQADEKFAETLVEWLKSPRTVANILEEAEIGINNMSNRKLAKVFRVQKLSSQVISVSYGSENRIYAEKISVAIGKVLEENTRILNQDQRESSWFKIIPHEPLIIKDQFNLALITIIAFSLGAFLAFWIVLFIHYIK